MMASTLRISDLGTPLSEQASDEKPANTFNWPVQLLLSNGSSCDSSLTDPLFVSGEGRPEADEDLIKWFLEKHTREPFEATKADQATRLIRAYGQKLARQLSSCGLLPAAPGHLEIEIATASSLQRLHWEVLEDVALWPEEHRFQSVSVFRTSAAGSTDSEPQRARVGGGEEAEPGSRKPFNILLVVSRPDGGDDLEYQLVSRCLIAIADKVSKVSKDMEVVVKLLRPPTWAAFQACLSGKSGRRYDLVHLDMHGAIRRPKKGAPRTATVCFCGKPDSDEPWYCDQNWVSGEEVGKVLLSSGVRIVVTNACESANSRREECGGNLAAILLSHGIESVVAMSFKVMDEAVEIFTDVFYTSLLLNRRPVEEAVRLSRLSLLQRTERRARHMYSVQLLDYIVPVLYRRPGKEIRARQSLQDRFTASVPFPRDFKSSEPDSPAHKRYYKDDTDHELVGRDVNILHLENALSAGRPLFLHGPGGCGKTSLVRHCAKWWQRSGWIRQSATVNFAKSLREPEGVGFQRLEFTQILDMIATQLGLPQQGRHHRSEQEVLEKLRDEACLLVLDSVESLSCRISDMERSEFEHDGMKRLRDFVQKASSDEWKSKVVMISRHGNDPFVDSQWGCVTYPLRGLGVIEGVRLFEQLAFGNAAEVPEALRHRRNIDLIRRIVILFEGNPAVLGEVAPMLRRLGHDIGALYDRIMYGKPEIRQGEREELNISRFAGTVAWVFAELEMFSTPDEVVYPFQVAPFWTIAPEDPRYYYWFLYLKAMPMFREASYATWLTDDFRATVEGFQQQLDINACWGSMLRRFELAGLAEGAVIKTDGGAVMRCYHLHPMVTLHARAQMPADQWDTMKAAFVRQFLLWPPRTSAWDENMHGFCGVTWNETDQHDDYTENLKAVAMAFALEGPDFQEEMKRMGCSVFDVVHLHSQNSFLTKARRIEPLLPLVRRHLERLHAAADARPGRVPTSCELEMIMNYSLECHGQEKDVIRASSLVSSALAAADRYRAASATPSSSSSSSSSPRPLTATQDLSVFQLRHAHACIVARRGGDAGGLSAMEHFQMNLEEDVAQDHRFYGAIRRVQLRNLAEWVEKALDEMRRGGDGAPAEQPLGLSMAEMARLVIDDPSFREGGFAGLRAAAVMQTPELFDRTPVKEFIKPVLEANPAAVARFGKITHRILEESIVANMADISGASLGMVPAYGASQAGEGGDGDGDGSAPSPSPLQVLQHLCLMSQPATDDENNSEILQTPGGEQTRNEMAMYDASIRMMAGQNGGLESGRGALAGLLEREGPHSTSSGGWERLAETHVVLYFAAVPWEDEDARDYLKGLRHLDEYWGLLRGEGLDAVPKRELVYTFVKYAVCYNGVGRVADAARAVLTAVPLVPLAVEAGECVNQMDAEEFDFWVYQRFAELGRLDIFLSRSVVANPPEEVRGMSIMERSFMLVVMTRAKQIQREKKRLQDGYQELSELLARTRLALDRSGWTG